MISEDGRSARVSISSVNLQSCRDEFEHHGFSHAIRERRKHAERAGLRNPQEQIRKLLARHQALVHQHPANARPPQAADRPTVPGIQHDATTGGADRGVSHEREGQNVARDRMEGKTGR